MGPIAAIAIMLVAGVCMIAAAVWLLAGFPWALLLAGICMVGAALFVRRGMTNA